MKLVEQSTLVELLEIIQSLETGKELQYSCKSPVEALISLKGEIQAAAFSDPVPFNDW